MIFAAVTVELIRVDPRSMGGANGFLLLRGPKFYARSTIPRKHRLWSQVVMDMA